MKKETDKNYWAKKQLNLKEALAFYHSGVWKDWDAEELVRFQLFQKRMCVSLKIFMRDLSIVFKRPVFTHELVGNNRKAFLEEYPGTRNPPTLEEIIALLPKGKELLLHPVKPKRR